MKLLKRLLVVVLVLLVLVAVGAGLFLDSIVKKVIETGGTQATGVPTTLANADASFFSGSFGMKDFAIANPPGFRAEPFLAFKEARARWQNGTILSDELVIDEFKLDGLTVNLERSGAGTNWGKIMDQLPKGADKPAEPAPKEGSGRSVVLKHIELSGVHAALHIAGLTDLAVDVPTIVIDDLHSNGSTADIVAKITRAVVQAVLTQVTSAGAGIFPADVLQDLKGGLKNLEQGLKHDMEKVLESGDLKTGVKDAEKTLQDLLKGKKK